eukprot:m.411167 g.411167  ORF g.411167 m.411167 type:complete len:301 (-) comp28583_c0_seq1:43-945(-)
MPGELKDDIIDKFVRADLQFHKITTQGAVTDAAVRAAIRRLHADHPITEEQFRKRTGADEDECLALWNDTTETAPIPLEITQYFKSLCDNEAFIVEMVVARPVPNDIVDTIVGKDLRHNGFGRGKSVTDDAVRETVKRLKKDQKITCTDLGERVGIDCRDIWDEKDDNVPPKLKQYFQSLTASGLASVVSKESTSTSAFAAVAVVSLTTKMSSLFQMFDDDKENAKGMLWIVAFVFVWLTFLALIGGVWAAATELWETDEHMKEHLAITRSVCAVSFSTVLIIVEGMVASLEARERADNN